VSAFTALLTSAAGVFRAPSFAIFTDLITGWLLAPGRRTVTAIIAVVDPAGRRAHDAYHRFVRDGVWAMSGLWRMLATHAVGACCPDVVSVDISFTSRAARSRGPGSFGTRCAPPPAGSSTRPG
jgi:DDE superfamily endonuclease